MPRPLNEPKAVKRKIHVELFDADYEYLNNLFGRGGRHEDLGLGRAIRNIIHQKVMGLKAREAGELDKLGELQRVVGVPQGGKDYEG